LKRTQGQAGTLEEFRANSYAPVRGIFPVMTFPVRRKRNG